MADPAAGSYYIESLTASIAEQAWELFRSVEDRGGLISYVKGGWLHEQISGVCRKRDMDIALRKTALLGTNIFPDSNEMAIGRINRPVKEEQTSGLKLYRGAAAIENIRLATEVRVSNGGLRPRVMLLTFGNLAMRKARATFSANFFGCAGYQILDETEYSNPEWMLSEVERNGADIVVICSSDDEYARYAPDIAAALLKASGNPVPVIAGNPAESMDLLRSAGIGEFIHVRSNLVETLTRFQQKFGIMQ